MATCNHVTTSPVWRHTSVIKTTISTHPGHSYVHTSPYLVSVKSKVRMQQSRLSGKDQGQYAEVGFTWRRGGIAGSLALNSS
jgi:hypothetical protein